MRAPDATSPSGRFFEKRRKVFPKAVDGRFRRLKWAIMAATLAIYYATPWLRWNRGPYAPDQAVLIDLEHRRFYMFAIEIWPHEFYFVAGLLIMAGIGLFLVTSAVGRAWCGYACPQTVWTDLFVHVERAIEGDRNAQFRLERAAWGPAKIARRVTKHAIWLLIAFLTGGAWIFYFADAPTLARAVFTGEAPFAAYATMGILTATTYVLGGLMREQVCIYMCPWPRIQGAMLDEKSLVVTYKDWRGEPRSHGTKRVADAPTGDCIDCDACVAVCPTGIDIRDGAQIGCISCALCIDACDTVMTRLGRPRGLIDYTTAADMALAHAGQPTQPPLKRLFHIRTIAYFAVWAAIGMGLLFALGTRARIVVSVLQDRNPIYVRLSDGSIRNDYLVKVRNMEDRPRQVEIAIDGVPGAVVWTEQGDRKAATDKVRLDLAADQVAQAHLFVAAGAPGPQRGDLVFAVRALDREAAPQPRDPSSSDRSDPMTRPFTGWHMLGIMLAMFGTIIAVNVVMATYAIRTFGGTVVDNSYVASQDFNHWLAEARAQKTLGWTIAVTEGAGHRPVIAIRTPTGTLDGAAVSAVATHPLGRAPAQDVMFTAGHDGRYVATRTLPDGRWLLRITVRHGGRTALFDDELKA